ncbi:MAG: hypothetical protein ACHQ50_05590 [Fimbriimonadales bacterium]
MKPIMAIVPVVIVAVIAGLGFAGVINIPGLTPKKAVKNAAQMYAQKDDKPVAANTAAKPATTPAPADKPKPKPVVKPSDLDPDQGADAIATVWNEIETPSLITITKDWSDADLAKVLAHMDTDAVAKFLDEMARTGSGGKPDPVRASKLSKVLRDQGAIIKPEEGKKTT